MVKKSIMTKKQKALAVVSAVAIAAAGIAGGFALDTPDTITEYVNNTIEVQGETVYVNVPIETVVEVEVDNGNLDMVLEYLEDNYGDDNLVFEDVRDIVDNIEMEDTYKNKALDMFEDSFKDEITRVPRGYDLSEASIVNIKDAVVKAVGIDGYDDKEFKVTFEAEIIFEDDDSKVTKFYDVTYDFDLDLGNEEDVEVSVSLV